MASTSMSSLHAPPNAAEEYAMVDRSAMADVQGFFSTLSHAESLQFCLGVEDTTDARFSKVPPLAYFTTVICFDTEGWNADSSKLTEVGFNRFSADSVHGNDTGPWGENALRKASFYHARIAENSHLENRSGVKGDPLSNRFGRSRFLSSSQACNALEEFFAVRTADGLGICPIVILGHALGNDTDKLEKLIGFNPNRLGNVVKEVDTQQIVRDLGFWTAPKNQVGLQRMIATLGFEYRDAHTASNDAAMTLIAAVLLVLPRNGYSKEKGLQEVVDGIERLSQGDDWSHGSARYCKRCHSRNHFAEIGAYGGGCKIPVHCAHCFAAGRRGAAKGHMTVDCVHFAFDNGNSKIAKERRETKREAAQQRRKKGDEPPAGTKKKRPAGSSEPRSNLPPLEELVLPLSRFTG